MTEPGSESFALSPAHFQRLRRSILWTAAAITPASIAMGALSGRRSATGWGSTIVAAAFMTSILAITLYLSYRKQVARWQTFRIGVSSDQVTRAQEGFEDVIVGASAITRMVRIPGRGLLIYAGHAQPAIVIPDTLERFDDCCTLVQRFRPIDVRARPLLPRWLTIPAILAFMVVYVAFERSADLRVVIGLGVLIACVMALGAWRLYGSPDVDKRGKKRLAWVLLLAIVPVGMRMWSTWSAPRRAEKAIQESHLLSLLVRAKPELHDRLREAILAGEKNQMEANGGSYVNPAASIISEVLPEYLPICSDEAIIRYTKETVTVLERLEADPSDLCYEWSHPHGVHVDILSVLGKGGLDPLTEAMAALVRSALAAPQPPPDFTEAEGLRRRAMEVLTMDASLGPVDLSPPGTPGFNKKRWCHSAESMFRVVLNLPEKQSSMLLRFMFTKTTKK